MSTAYYALFHCLARCCADTLVGKTRTHRREPAWRQAYRALEHGRARAQCSRPAIRGFPPGIERFAEVFVDMQGKRHRADYEPRPLEGRWKKSDVADHIAAAAETIAGFEAAPLPDRRAFAVFVLLKSRSP